jgi:hypothetical protein
MRLMRIGLADSLTRIAGSSGEPASGAILITTQVPIRSAGFGWSPRSGSERPRTLRFRYLGLLRPPCNLLARQIDLSDGRLGDRCNHA